MKPSKPKRLILKPWQVAACLRGDKTQHRVLVKEQPLPGGEIGFSAPGELVWLRKSGLSCTVTSGDSCPSDYLDDCPYPVGSEVWVPEKWRRPHCNTGTPLKPGQAVLYRAGWDFHDGFGEGWRPARTMPYWAARLHYTVADVRCQRVQDISEADAVAEGCRGRVGGVGGQIVGMENKPISPRRQFENHWDATHGPGSWDRNDWVWALTLERKPGGGA